ncbi:cardiolipin synthase [Bacteroidia bacterium]|nr:cardiolipin synthase [Bacteroidia bacterium]
MLLENRNPVRSLAWLLVMIFVPFVGLLLYLILGMNLPKNHLIQRKSIRSLTQPSADALNLSKIDFLKMDSQSAKLSKLLYNNGNSVGYAYNKINILSDGESSFESIFEAIKNAKSHIHIEFFIFADDRISNQLRELLIQKASEGVRVRMIYDYWGSLALTFSKKYLKSLREAGVYVKPFLPLRIRLSRSKINYRNHRKIIIIDGKIGFTGGINVADRYIYGNRLGQWRDTLVRLEGSVVHGLQMLFLTDWHFVGAKLITDAKYFPVSKVFDERNLIQVVASGPDTDWQTIQQGFAQAIMSAKKYVFIQTPYFLPPETINSCVQVAALSGIDVRLMIPQKSDTVFTHIGTYSFLGQLLEAGVRVYRYNGGFLHSKATVIDDKISIVGSANMDERSFTQNFEANVVIYETATAEYLQSLFIKDLECCEELALEKWNARSRWQKLKEAFVRLFSPLL